ncbi:MAG: glycosyltransferase family 4 protein [Anaerolineae bacterium]|nr:glycosyltransferase family 4 protein [Anaerolineae bacterium]
MFVAYGNKLPYVAAMIYFVYPRLKKLSGAERLILALAGHITQLGTPVTLLTHYFDANCAPALAPQVTLFQTGDRLEVFDNHYLDAPLEYLHSLRLLKQIRADADAVTFFGPPSLPALAVSARQKQLRAPKLYFCYEPPRFIYDDADAVTARMGVSGMAARPFFGLYKMLDRAMVRRADALLANSHFGAERLRAAYEREASVITHGSDFKPAPAPEIQTMRARYDLEGKIVFLTVNFLHPRKRIDLFLRALAQLYARVPNVAALVVGAGPEQDALHALARELNITDIVRFTGFVPDAQLPALYGASDVYVHTCKNESFGLSVLEASAAGLPVVAVDEGGPREILERDITGLLVAPTADAVEIGMFALAQDPAERAQMGAAGKARTASMYSWERGAREFLAVVAQLHSGVTLAPQVGPKLSN